MHSQIPKEITMSKCSLRFVVLLLVVPLILVACGDASPAEDETSEGSDPLVEIEIPTLAFEGVTRNDDWEPIVQNINGGQMALVPAGCFMMGSEDGNDDEQPIHEVCFEEPFWIDVYEVSNARFGSVGCEEQSSEDEQPRNCVSWYEAADHCEARGARLPTEAEWEYAARGPDALIYPWGNEFDCSLGNFDDETQRNSYVVEGGEGCDGFVVTAPVGSFPGGASWVGAYDMSGNAWEWVSDWYDPGYYANSPTLNPQGPDTGEHRVQRGGSWDDHGTNSLRAANRQWNRPVSAYPYHGFRCVLSE
jgi:formylglycine-generating enzyme required for sulfatase activity